ncbi:MAG: DsrE family protein [Sphingomonadales bacterium]|jgi:intracellular sulfur oxidation DsrE/DsrF family protein
MKKLLLGVLSICFLSGSVIAGPDDPSKFKDTPYDAQKSLYDFNFQNPEDGEGAFHYIHNQLNALEKFGDGEKSHVVIVAHGNVLHAMARENRGKFPDMYTKLKKLTDRGVSVYACRNSARSRGYDTSDFYDLVTVVPAAVAEIAKWQNEGYSYMYAEWFPRLEKEEIFK